MQCKSKYNASVRKRAGSSVSSGGGPEWSCQSRRLSSSVASKVLVKRVGVTLLVTQVEGPTATTICCNLSIVLLNSTLLSWVHHGSGRR